MGVTTTLELSLAGITVVLVLMQLLLAFLQTRIASRQADIMDRQTLIAMRQTEIAAQERQINTRPNIVSEIVVTGDEGRRYWRLTNAGGFAIDNVDTRYLRFVLYPESGWHVRNQAFVRKPNGLAPKETWAVDLSAQMERFRMDAPTASSTLGEDYLVLLLFFERRIDGRPYVLTEPLYAVGNGAFTGMSLDTGGSAGPMDFHRNVAIELTFEFFKRHPFDRNYELFNSNYLLGYKTHSELAQLERTPNSPSR